LNQTPFQKKYNKHPFFINNAWIAAEDLKRGDSLLAFAGYKVAIDSCFSFRVDTATAVYNLEVAGNSNYYVSASAVLVHKYNAKWPPPPRTRNQTTLYSLTIAQTNRHKIKTLQISYQHHFYFFFTAFL
jgi:hypothetical protein